jgi:hypothetical protein
VTGFYLRPRTGRPPNECALRFAECAADIFERVTKKPATRRLHSDKGEQYEREYGPFRDFLRAAIEPTGLRRAGVKVDALLRKLVKGRKQHAAGMDKTPAR